MNTFPSASSASRWPVEASLGVCVLIWGTNFVIIKAALPTMHPHVLNLLRMSAALLVVGGLHVSRERSRGHGPFEALKVGPWQIAGTGLLGYLLYQVTFIIGLNNTLAGSAALIMASAPIWTAILSMMLGLEFLTFAAWIGLALSLSGVVAIVLSGRAEVDLGYDALFGNLMMVGAAFLWASYTTLNRGLLGRIRALSLTFYGVLFSMVPLALVSLPYWSTVDWSRVTPLVWGAIAFSGAFSTGLTVVLWNDAVRQIGPSRTAVFNYLVPVIALITGVTFLGEHIEPGQVVGGALVILGLVTVRLSRHKLPSA